MSICPHILLLIYQCVFQEDLIPVYIVWQHWNLKTCIKLVRKKGQGTAAAMCPWMHAPLCCKRNEDVLLLSCRQRTGCDLFQSSSSYLQDYVFSRCGDLQLESGSTIKPHQLWDFRFPLCDFSHPLDKKYQFSHASRWKSPHKTDQKILVLKMASEPLRESCLKKIPAHPQPTLASCCVLTLPWPHYFQNVSE